MERFLEEQTEYSKKSVQKSIRLSDSTFSYVERFNGTSFNDKLENLILFVCEKLPDLEQRAASLQAEVQELQKQRDMLSGDIANLQMHKNSVEQAFDTFSRLQAVFREEVFAHNCGFVAEKISKAGFKPTEKAVNLMMKLDEVTGERNQIRDIKRLTGTGTYAMKFGDSVQVIAEELCKEFREQELRKRAVIQPPKEF